VLAHNTEQVLTLGGRGSLEIGGTAADAAATVAASQPPGSPNVSTLNAELPKHKWVDGATNVPYSSLTRPIVSVNLLGTDIVTAVQSGQGLCSFGLSIISSSDPLITEDHLSGPGTYYQSVQTSPRIADQAPMSSWMVWPQVSRRPYPIQETGRGKAVHDPAIRFTSERRSMISETSIISGNCH
jgi:hypothetical protein